MFHFLKKKEAVKKYMLIGFLGIVSLSMVVVMAPLPSGDTSRNEGNVLASIGGQNITSTELDQTIRDRFKNSPMGFDPRMVPLVAPRVLDQMETEQILKLQAAKLGVEVSDQEVLKAFQSIPWMYPDGNFVGADRAAELVAEQTGMSLPQFEAMLRDSLLEEKVRTIVTDGVEVTPSEVQAEFQKRNAKAKIDYVVFDPSQFIKDVTVTPDALEAFFKKDPARYKLPEQRQVRYVVIDPDQVRSQLKISDADLHEFYTQHLADYRVPDRVKVDHILFKTTGKTPAEIANIQKTAADVLNQIRAGANFADLAKKYSEDSTAQNGGDLGWIVHGQTVPEFESAAFSLKPGQVSGLIKTVYGIHIIKLDDKQVAHLQSFDEVKDSIRADLEKQQLADLQTKVASDLAAELKANPQQFEQIAGKAGMESKATPLFKYNEAVPDLGKTDAFENLAFQLRLNEVGQPISVPKGTAIVQLVQIVPEHTPSLAEVHAQVEEDYRHAQSITLAQDKAKKLAELAKSQDFDKAAKSLGLTPKQSNDFSQSEYVEGAGSGTQLSDAFTLNPGQVSGVVSTGSNQVVFKVVSHTPANEADFSAQADQIREELLDQKRDLQFEIFRQNLRDQYLRSGKLKVNQAAMREYLASLQTQ